MKLEAICLRMLIHMALLVLSSPQAKSTVRAMVKEDGGGVSVVVLLLEMVGVANSTAGILEMGLIQIGVDVAAEEVKAATTIPASIAMTVKAEKDVERAAEVMKALTRMKEDLMARF